MRPFPINSFFLSEAGKLIKRIWPGDTQLFLWFLLFYTLIFINLSNRLLLGFELLLVLFLTNRFKDLKLSLWLTYLFFLPFEKGKGFVFELVPQSALAWGSPVNYWFTATFADVAFGVLILVFLREEIIRGWGRVRESLRGEDILLFLFLGTGIVSLFFSSYPLVSFLNFLRLVRIVAVYFVVRQILIKHDTFFKTISVLAASLFFQGIWTAGQFLNRGPLGRSIEQIGTLFSSFGQTAAEQAELFRPQGTFVHPNALASFLGTLIPFFAILLLTRGEKLVKQWVFLPCLFFGSLALVFTASRAAWIVVFGILILAAAFLHQKKQLLLEPWLKGVTIRLSLVLLVFIPFLILPRMASLYQAFQTYGSGYYRFDLISRSIDLVQRFPLGIGLGMFPAALVYEFPFDQFFDFPAPPHNIFSHIASEMGILGFTFFVLFLLFSFKRFFKEARPGLGPYSINVASFFAALSFLGLASFYPLFLVPNLFDYFWLLLALMLI